MENMNNLSAQTLADMKKELMAQYEGYKAQGLKLDLSRGKPSPEQLDLGLGLFDVINSKSDMKTGSGADIRNYGLVDGVDEAKNFFSGILGVPAGNIIVGGNSSLNLMYDYVVQALLLGVCGGEGPWVKQGKLKFICPSPGYDRHFAITEQFGFEMVTVEMRSDGPDMDAVEKLVESDASVKGIWCIPKYSNPTGVVYSDDVVRRLARMKPAASDFRIFCDNAYAVHDLYPGNAPKLLDLFDECQKAGNEDRPLLFASTSKISFSGAGIACAAASANNIAQMKKNISIQTIGYDKINQLRHARYFSEPGTLARHMAAMADLIRPKFEAVLRIFEDELNGSGVAEWTHPLGGYFISVNVTEGCAQRTVALCKEAGVVLTGAGATYPLRHDPLDRNIRIAPTYPQMRELELTAKLFCLCVKIAAVEKLGKHKS